ncbi:MAG: cyclic nucleotide-binding domain-containing protein [Planctomycetes bacterium]|nr:cyclic nucleotide-binding domain-containing protein [Planctomycetota bacterium]
MGTNTTVIKKATLFSDLNESQLQRLADAGEPRTCPAGSTLFEEGSKGSEFYLVEAGAVEISKNIAGGRKKVLTRIESGEVFGELALFDRSPRSATATADGECRLLVFREDRFNELLKSDSGIAFPVLSALLRLLCQRIRTSNEKMKEGIVWGFQVRM